MRLQRIKLAGFKSFVDPTVIDLRSNLVGIVGPNGCGKSNVIDAVRWVMGESSAKTLRGESMEDVIFNGAAGRKPVGQASVELLFDNSDGSLGGEYATYSEISIRREVTRDAQSAYYLNGTRCRRRDIKDIFLGTGLGPGSYAIIQQGTVSRIIEANPRDMRQFVEEAAGISLYKDRRRETENRMRHTRENLERVNDIREELDKQLERLKRQSRAAVKYKALKVEQRQLQAQLYALKLQAIETALETKKAAMQKEEVALESNIADLRACDRDIEALKEKQVTLNDAVNLVQKSYYEIGEQIVRLEQSLQHGRDHCQSIREDLAKTKAALTDAKTHHTTDNEKIDGLDKDIAELTPEVETAKIAADTALGQLNDAECAMQQWQVRWDEFNTQAALVSEKAQVEKMRIQQLEQRIDEASQRIETIESEKLQLDLAPLQAQISDLNTQLNTQQASITQHQDALASSQTDIQTQRSDNQTRRTQLDTLRSQLQQDQGRFASLEALQQAALGQQSKTVVAWLTHQGLADLPRLAQTLTVEAGWELAVETVLGASLEAVCLPNMDSVEAILGNTALPKGQLTLLDMQAAISTAAPDHRLTPLADKVNTSQVAAGLLKGIYIAETLTHALAVRHQLADNESIVTQAGIWISQSWIRIAKTEDVRSGVLEREKALQDLHAQIKDKEQIIAEQAAQLAAGEQALQTLEQARETAQTALNQSKDSLNQNQTQLKVIQARCEQLSQRRLLLDDESQTLHNSTQTNRQALDEARGIWQGALSQMQTQADKRDVLSNERNTYQRQLETIRPQAHSAKDHLHQITVTVSNMQRELSTLTMARDRLNEQVSELTHREQDLTARFETANAPLAALETELNSSLTKRADVDVVLQQERARLQALEADLREKAQVRDGVEKCIENTRAKLETMRIDSQAETVRRTDLAQQLEDMSQTLSDVLASIVSQTSVADIDTRLLEVGQSIGRLGAINLAAIEEYDVELERKQHLDSQYTDLSEALNTLEAAIRKIDKETRQRFKDTFDNINNHFKTLFPTLFEGGEAYLALTGEDLLDTGVTVMARPPGKRNSSIHLLSGGEKALTAISLVFAIFKLNPAPFCILDEVDAPLDDANVGRFCQLVENIAQNIQVLFISHNKVAIEMSKQLMGVTMHEPGVSRLVSVDIEEAVAIAHTNTVAAPAE